MYFSQFEKSWVSIVRFTFAMSEYFVFPEKVFFQAYSTIFADILPTLFLYNVTRRRGKMIQNILTTYCPTSARFIRYRTFQTSRHKISRLCDFFHLALGEARMVAVTAPSDLSQLRNFIANLDVFFLTTSNRDLNANKKLHELGCIDIIIVEKIIAC